MKIIGLTGPSGAGKGMAASVFEYHNIPGVDTDAVYREVIAPPSKCLDELVREFGKKIIRADGTLNRKKLAEIVFSDKTKIKQKRLNEITHKYIRTRSKELISEFEKNGERFLVFEVPLLFESGFDADCDVTVSVIADRDTRIARIVKRDNISRRAAAARVDAQMPDDFYISHSDYVVYNNGTQKELSEKIEGIIKELEGSSD